MFNKFSNEPKDWRFTKKIFKNEFLAGDINGNTTNDQQARVVIDIDKKKDQFLRDNYHGIKDNILQAMPLLSLRHKLRKKTVEIREYETRENSSMKQLDQLEN